MRHLPDGSLLFSRSEKIPKDIPGYKPDPGDPYHWVPEPPPCSHRERALIELPCKKVRSSYFCKFFKHEVSLAVCNECDEESGLTNN